jgi:hypothetical protein
MSNPIGIRRRDVLRGLGAGAALFAPLARSLEARAAAPAGNFVVFYTPNGHVRSAFGASGSGAAFTLKPSLAPLEPYKASLSVCANLDNPGASSKGSHEDCVRTLTCVPGGDIYRGYGTSIDWVVANHLGSRPLTLSTLWKQAPNWQSKISWKSNGVFDPHLDDAGAVYADLFARFVPSQSPGEVDKILAQGRSVLDFVREDVSLLAPRLPAAERGKMSNHLDALRQLEKGLGASAVAASCATGPLKTRLDAGTAGLTGGAELQRALELKIDLIATAFSCGVRRVATLLTQGASGGRNPLGGLGHHNVSHYEGTNPTELWKQIDRWYAERFATLVKRLAELRLLETTIAVWCTEISEGHVQSGFVIPVAGGGALGIQPMQTFGSKSTLSNLWVSVQKALGVPSDTFGAGSSGGIPGLLK